MVVLSEKMEGMKRRKIYKENMIAIYLWLFVRILLSLYLERLHNVTKWVGICENHPCD